MNFKTQRHIQAVPQGAAPASIVPARTPYHSLGDGDMRIPSWAQHRSVYRTGGRTLYLVETDSLGDARGDLDRLSHAGWDVRVAQDPAGSTDTARIALTRKDLARAA